MVSRAGTSWFHVHKCLCKPVASMVSKTVTRARVLTKFLKSLTHPARGTLRVPPALPAPPPLIESPDGGQMAPGRSATACGLYTLSLPSLSTTAAENLKGRQSGRAGQSARLQTIAFDKSAAVDRSRCAATRIFRGNPPDAIPLGKKTPQIAFLAFAILSGARYALARFSRQRHFPQQTTAGRTVTLFVAAYPPGYPCLTDLKWI